MLMLSKSYLNKLSLIFFVAFASAIYIDFIASNAIFSRIFALAFVLLSIVLFVLNRKPLLLKIILALILLIPEFPRDILDVYDSLSSHELVYRPIASYGFGPFRLELVVLILMLIGKRLIIDLKDLILFAVLGLLVFFSLMLGWTNDIDTSGYNNALYLFRGLVFYFVATFAYRELPKEELLSLLKIIFSISGLRTIIFIVFDATIKGGEFSLDLGGQPYLFLLFLLSLRDSEYRALGLWPYLNLLFPSRSFILIAIAVFGVLWLARWNLIVFMRRVANLAIILVISGFMLKSYNERLYYFFLWKFEVLEAVSGKSQMSGSGNVRRLELLNIWRINNEEVGSLLLGNGPYAKYDFEYYPLKVEGVIDSKSYSLDQRREGKFYTTHNFISAWLLKFGLLGLVWYITFLSRYYTDNVVKNNLISFILIYVFYSTPVAAIMLIFLAKNEKGKLDYSNV